MLNILQRIGRNLRARWKLATGLLATSVVVVVLVIGQIFGVLAFERHRGYFAPVWAPDGQHVYVIERKTQGLIWGLGWEGFSPPANSYVISDRLALGRLNIANGKLETLERFDDSPIAGRAT